MRERANGDRERNRKLHESCDASSQYRHRNVKLYHLTYRARKVPQLSPAENQKQRREKKTRRENNLIVDAVYKHALFKSIIRNPEEQSDPSPDGKLRSGHPRR